MELIRFMGVFRVSRAHGVYRVRRVFWGFIRLLGLLGFRA